MRTPKSRGGTAVVLLAAVLACSCQEDRDVEWHPQEPDLAASDGSPPNVGANLVHWDVLKGVPQGAVAGEVLQWDGTEWQPAAVLGTGTVTQVDAAGGLTIDVGSIVTAGTISIADGGVTAPKLAQMGAADGQVLKWDGGLTSWQAADEVGVSYAAGPGIDITSDVILVADQGVTGEMIDGTGALDGDVLKWNSSFSRWEPAGDAGIVDTVVAGTGISVDSSDPANPVVSTDLATSDGDAPNVGSNLVSWDNLVDVPAGFADGLDAGAAGGDDWGAQVVQTTARLTGDGAATPLDLAQQGASAGEVLAWSGSDWGPAAVDSASIANGTIVDADISPGAAISASKINTTGLDADTVDTYHAAQLGRLASNQEFTGWNLFSNRVGIDEAPAMPQHPLHLISSSFPTAAHFESSYDTPSANVLRVQYTGPNPQPTASAIHAIQGNAGNALYAEGNIYATGNISTVGDIDVAGSLAVGAGAIVGGNLDVVGTISGDGSGLTGLDAGNISAGTLGNGFFSAYSDLATEGYLDNNSATDLLTRSQSDGRFVSVTGDTMSGQLSVNTASGSTYSVYADNSENTASSRYGIYGRATGGSTGARYGVRGHADGSTGTCYGIYGSAAGTGTNYGVYSSGNMHATGNISTDGDTDVAGSLAVVAGAIVGGNLDVAGTISGDGSGLTGLDAGNVSAGALGDGFFSAYSDLATEGYLDNNSATDLLTRSQSDGRFVSVTGDTMTGTLTLNVSDAYGVNINNGYTAATSYGVYGRANGTGTGDRYGIRGLATGGGGTNYGVYGSGTDYGVYSQGDMHATGNVTCDGNVAIGAAAALDDRLYVFRPATDWGPGRAGIYSYRTGSNIAVDGGTSWSVAGVDAAISAHSSWGNNYTAAIYADSFLDYTESAALVADGGGAEAKLCYRDGSSSLWAGHFTGNVNVTGTVTATGITMPTGAVAGYVLTTTAGDGVASWQPTGSAAWGLAGNAGTDPLTNFIGTTDNAGFEIKVASLRAVRIEPDTTTSEGPNIIGGASNNSASAGVVGATIAGGGAVDGALFGMPGTPMPNLVTDHYGTVGGGVGNQAGDNGGTLDDAWTATVSGGRSNTASRGGATVGGGIQNTAISTDSTVGGGELNNAGGVASTIGGGYQNTTSADCTTVGGGEQNLASSMWSTVPGGLSNTAQGDYSFAAGRRAKALAAGSFVWADSTDADFTVAAGTPDVFAVRAAGGVGLGVTAPNSQLDVAGGLTMRMASAPATPATTGVIYFDGTKFKVSENGGAYVDLVSAAGSGWSLTGNAGTTAGTNFIGTTDAQAFEVHVQGARVMRYEPDATSPNIIGGYSGNWVTAGVKGATIGGGGENVNENRVTDDYGTVAGGYRNQAGNNAPPTDGSPYVTVGGGAGNTASGLCSTVAGGESNQAQLDHATVGGGGSNIAGGLESTVGGGLANTASASRATVGGGGLNTASGWGSTVPGGDSNTAQGQCSFAAGRRAKANHQGAFVWADSQPYDFPSGAVDDFSVRCTGGARFVTAIDGTGAPTAGVAVTSGASELAPIAGTQLTLACDTTVTGGVTVGTTLTVPTGAAAGRVLTCNDATGSASWQPPGAAVGTVPIGGVVAWLKSYTNTPALPADFVECNGQVLSDAASPYDGQTIPDLNGGNRFLRGGLSSGAAGGSTSHKHRVYYETSSTTTFHFDTISGYNAYWGDGTPLQSSGSSRDGYSASVSHLPPYYEVVWIMRVK